MFTVRMIASNEEFSALRASWQALVATNTDTSIFQTWEWAYSWWETYRAGSHLSILLALDANGVVVGIAPLMRRRAYLAGVPVMRLDFIGGHSTASEYLDFVVSPSEHEVVVGLFLDAIFGMNDWHFFGFHQLPLESPTYKLVERYVSSRGGLLSPLTTEPSLFVKLPESWDTYLAALRPHARKNLRRYRRQIEADEKFEGIDDCSDDAAMMEFERLHQLRMRAADRVTSFESEKFRSFHAKLAVRLRESRHLEVLLLRYANRNVAALYGFPLHGRWFFYNSGFDPEYGDKNVSTVLLSFAIERCIARGFREFDFLGPGEYKERWAVESRQKISFMVSRRPVLTRWFHCVRIIAALPRTILRRRMPAGLRRRLSNIRRHWSLP